MRTLAHRLTPPSRPNDSTYVDRHTQPQQNQAKSVRMTPVHEAAERGDVEALAVIAREDRTQLRARDPFDRTPLLWVRNALLGPVP
jgi:hypothetical protein